jgi:hypothetical protein
VQSVQGACYLLVNRNEQRPRQFTQAREAAFVKAPQPLEVFALSKFDLLFPQPRNVVRESKK